MSDLQENEEERGLYDLFVCEDYSSKVWNFGDLKQELLCSAMSSTDHDLTGQIVWPASIVLSWFIYKNKNIFNDKVVIELGAGCGLAGFVSSNFAKKVIITDGNDIVMKLIEKNKDHLQSQNVIVKKLLWGLRDEIKNVVAISNDEVPDIIIGADVILWPNQLISLLFTIKWFLLLNSKAVTFISYIDRFGSTTSLFYEKSKEIGLIVESIPVESFIEKNILESQLQNTGFKYLFKVTLNLDSQIDENEEIIKYRGSIESSFMPC